VSNPNIYGPFQGFNGADLRNVCTEAGMAAIRAERDYVVHEDFMKVGYHIQVFYFCVPHDMGTLVAHRTSL
jgi:ATP-dependent 26S proteasome regulatory subunit